MYLLVVGFTDPPVCQKISQNVISWVSRDTNQNIPDSVSFIDSFLSSLVCIVICYCTPWGITFGSLPFFLATGRFRLSPLKDFVSTSFTLNFWIPIDGETMEYQYQYHWMMSSLLWKLGR